MTRASARAVAWALALFAGTAAAFWPILGNGFVNWDDPGNIVANPWLGRFDPAGLLWAFRSTLYGHFQPLAWLSLSLDKVFWGLDPGGFHLTSLLLHAASAALVFLFLRGLLDDAQDADLPAAAAAALFAWHPLRVESVAWATERRDQLALVFLALSAVLYLRAVRRDERAPDLRPALAAFAAALLSKVTAVVFPALLLCLDRGVLKREGMKRLAAEKSAFWIAGAAALALGMRAQWAAGAAPGLGGAGVLDRLAVLAWTPGWTAWKTLLPARLSPFVYVDWSREPARFWPMAVLTAGLVGGWLALGRRRAAAFWLGAAWLVALSPALGIFKSGPQTCADRFTLMPALTLSVAAALVFRRLGRRAAWGALALAALLGALSRAQARVWQDSVSLWTRAADVGPANPLTIGNLAAALRAAGREPEAEALYKALSEADPQNPAALAVAGDSRFEVGDWAAAEDLYARALSRNPDLPTVRVNRGLALYRLGRVPEAADEFAAAADAAPQLPDAWHNLGIALARLGRYQDADRCLSRALRLDPSRADSRRARAQLRPFLAPAK